MIELLVVVGILALLGGIATIAADHITESSGVEVCQVERATIINAMTAAKAKPGASVYRTYLSDDPRYFVNTGTYEAPVWEPSSDHPGGACQATIPVS